MYGTPSGIHLTSRPHRRALNLLICHATEQMQCLPIDEDLGLASGKLFDGAQPSDSVAPGKKRMNPDEPTHWHPAS
jgi:hypothetical protein